MADAPGEVVIVGTDGTEHVFPAGFDPKRAAAIVRGQGTTKPDFSSSNAKDANGNAVVGGDVLLDNLRMMMDAPVGAAKGLGRTAVGLGQLTHKIPGVSPAVDALYRLFGVDVHSHQAMGSPAAASAAGLDTNTNAERLGALAEQFGEFLLPGAAAEKTAATIATKAAPYLGKVAPLASRVAVQGGVNAGITAAQGGDPAVGGVAGGAIPVLGAAAGAAGRAVGDTAVPLVRSAIKATVSELKQIPGASQIGINAESNRLAKFIVDHRLTSPEKAQAVIDGAERELTTAIQKAGNPTTDAPQRAMRYISALRRSASQQGLPSDDVAIITAKAQELLDASPMSNGAGQLKPGMSATDALRTARQTSKWSTRKAYGEMKGAATESEKAVERGARDAVKAAVPDAKPILQRESQAITAKKVLDRQAFREGNRDAVSLPAHVIAAGELAKGKPPVLAIAANWLRNNQMKAGIYADRLASAIKRNDVQTVTAILGRLGVAGVAEATNPAYAP